MGLNDAIEMAAMYCHEKLQRHGPKGFSRLNAWAHEIANIDRSTKLDVYLVAKWAWDNPFWQARITSPLFMRRNWPQIEAQYKSAQTDERREIKKPEQNPPGLLDCRPITPHNQQGQETERQPATPERPRCVFVGEHCSQLPWADCQLGCKPHGFADGANPPAVAFSRPSPGQVSPTP